MGGRRLDPIGDVMTRVVADDEDLRKRARRLVLALLKDAEHTVQFGTAAERANLTKSIVPALLRSMQGADADAKEGQKRVAFERMLASMRGELPATGGVAWPGE